MTPRKGPTKWSVLAAIGVVLVLGGGVVVATPRATGHPGSGTPTVVSADLGSDVPSVRPAEPPPAGYSVLNESTLVLSNDTLVPGDFLAESAGLPSLETYDPLTDEVFVESFYSGLIDVISGESNKVVATISTGEYPNTIAFDPENNNIYFGLQTYDEVSVVNASTDLIQRTVGIGVEPLSMAADPVNGDLFVTGTNSTGTAFVVVLSGSSGVVVNTFSFGADRFPVAGPNGIAFDPVNGDFYVPSVPTGNPEETRGNLTLINASKEAVVGNLSLRFNPSSILYASSNEEFYLGNQSGDNLRLFDPATGKVGKSVPIPNTSLMLAYDSTDQDLFVGIEGNVTVVSSTTNSIVTTFAVTRNPDGLAYDPMNKDLYISDYVWNNVSVVSAETYKVVGAALLGSSPYNMAYDAANGDLYIGDLLSSQLIVVKGSTNRVVGYVPLGTTPYGVAYDPVTKEVYVDDYYASNVSVVNGTTNKVIGYLPAGTEPWGIAYDGANHDLYVTNPGSDNITVLNPSKRTVVTSIPFTTAPGAIAYDPKSSTMFVGEYDVGNVSVLNAKTNALIRNSSTGSEVYTIAIDPGTGRAFVGNFGSDNVTVLGPTGAELGLSVTAGVGVFGSAYDPADGDIYVVSFYSDLVTVINSTTATGVGGYSTGVGPVAAAVDPHTDMVFVANYDSDSLTLLSPTFRVEDYNVTFHETGLPSGTVWSIRLDGVGESGDGPNITYREPNGTGQPYSIGQVSGYDVSPEFGSVSVKGKSLVVTVRFTPAADDRLVTSTVTRSPDPTTGRNRVGVGALSTGAALATYGPHEGSPFVAVGISVPDAKDSGPETGSGVADPTSPAFATTAFIAELPRVAPVPGTDRCATTHGRKA